MFQKKKGFTLIELLAVIVILAVIALIATPLIMNVINDAKKNAVKDSAYGIIESAKYRIMRESDSATGFTGVKIDLTKDTLDYNGEKPTEGWISITADGKVSLYMKSGDYWIIKTENSNEVIVTTENAEQNQQNMEIIEEDETLKELAKERFEDVKITYVAPTSTDTHLGIIYLDPTDVTKVCTAAQAASNLQGKSYNNTTTLNGTKSGCMKWYLYKDNEDGTMKAILDHNTTPIVHYNYSGSNDMGTEDFEIKQVFKADTKDWSPLIHPEIISANELTFTTTVSFDEATSSPSNMFYFGGTSSDHSQVNKYAWLFDYTNCSECDHADSNEYTYSYGTYQSFSGVYGYWTKSKVAGYNQLVWNVSSYGYVGARNPNNVGPGIRPVITVSKNCFVSS